MKSKHTTLWPETEEELRSRCLREFASLGDIAREAANNGHPVTDYADALLESNGEEFTEAAKYVLEKWRVSLD